VLKKAEILFLNVHKRLPNIEKNEKIACWIGLWTGIFKLQNWRSCRFVWSWNMVINCSVIWSSVSIVSELWAEWLGFDSWQGWGLFLSTASTLALGPTQPPLPRVNQPEHEADHSHPSSAKIKNVWNYNFTLPYVFMVWCLIKHWKHLHGVVLS
jgi:hypothetical protein